MQDPNEDTEWNDILRRKGILPAKEAPPEEEDVKDIRVEEAKHTLQDGQRKAAEDMTLEELEQVEDAEEEAILEAIRYVPAPTSHAEGTPLPKTVHSVRSLSRGYRCSPMFPHHCVPESLAPSG